MDDSVESPYKQDNEGFDLGEKPNLDEKPKNWDLKISNKTKYSWHNMAANLYSECGTELVAEYISWVQDLLLISNIKNIKKHSTYVMYVDPWTPVYKLDN